MRAAPISVAFDNVKKFKISKLLNKEATYVKGHSIGRCQGARFSLKKMRRSF